MASPLEGTRRRIRDHLYRRPDANSNASVWKIVIGCFGLFVMLFSLLFGSPSYSGLAVIFLGLALASAGIADRVYVETRPGVGGTTLLRAVSLLAYILVVVFVAADILARIGVLP